MLDGVNEIKMVSTGQSDIGAAKITGEVIIYFIISVYSP